MQDELKKFLQLFRFNSGLAGYIGIERERFLRSKEGLLVPASSKFLDMINDPLWTYELSACQVEDRTNPEKSLAKILKALRHNDRRARQIAGRLGFKLCNKEIAEENMPLDIFPDERYLKIASRLPKEILMAACRVIGIHIHIGMKDIEHAICAHNILREHLAELCAIGDHSSGERLELYKKMAPNWRPPHYKNPERLLQTAKAQGFRDNPRNCWHLIRISIHGTVELRMFGSSVSNEGIISWIKLIRKMLAKNSK
ncbi:hypothetical protein KJ885_03610 [Patescibacteria group bacterium]|nr:hypothetical protein [Patescibacteria group bacterium]